jgi:hypothetical protein
MLNEVVPHERGQNRLADAVSLHCDLYPSRSQNLEWFMPTARPMPGQMELASSASNLAKRREMLSSNAADN